MPDVYAAKEDPTEPLEPTRYPSDMLFSTSFLAMIYITAYPLEMMEFSSLASLCSTIGGSSSPYCSCALA